MSLFDKVNLPAVTKSYKVHSFTSGGTFAVTGSGNVEYLVIAGAGGGGGGGGGAGGYRTNVSGETSGGGASAEATYGVTAQNYTITVGSGGSGSNAQSGARGGSGGNSSIVPASGTSIISLGGAGGGVGPQSAITGGSGGGGSYDLANQNGSAGTSGQGFAGGSNGGFTSSPTPAGGGGGSSSVGANAVNSTTSGAGGAGTSSSIIGSAVIRAGGGGGGNTRNTGSAGSGGSGGGTSGVLQGSSGSTSASANTGSGSGGGGDQNNGSGGSGIVIVRYLTSSGITATGGTVTNISELTGVANQRVVDNFSGSVLDTDRWNSTFTGNGTATMADEVEGGLKVTCASDVSASYMINFNNTRTFSPTGSACIFVGKRVSTTNTQMLGGLSSNTAFNADVAGVKDWTGNTYKQFSTAKNGYWVNANTTVAIDTNWHVHKIELLSASAILSMDGIIEVTNTGNIPDSPLQPVFSSGETSGVASAKTCQIRYMEAYNT